MGTDVLLSEAVGLRRAREMSVTTRAIDAGTALSWGLVNHVVPNILLPFATDLATQIADNDVTAVERVSDLCNKQRVVRDEKTRQLESDAFLPFMDFKRRL